MTGVLLLFRRMSPASMPGMGGTEYICYKKDSNFSFKSIKIPIPYFSHLLADYFDGQEVTAYEKKLLYGISKVSEYLTPDHSL